MELEDLFIWHFRVEKIHGRMVAFPDPKGQYRAASADLVEQALTKRKPPEGVDVQIGPKWYPIRLPRPRRKGEKIRRFYYDTRKESRIKGRFNNHAGGIS